MDILMLKLLCNKHVFTKTPIPPFVEEEDPFVKHVHVKEKNLGQES
jgi:hypothetical protein